MSLLPPKVEGSSPSNTLGHDASYATSTRSGTDSTDGSGLFHWSFTLRGAKHDQEEVRELDKATEQALAPHDKPLGPWIDTDSSGSHWKVLAHEAMDAEDVKSLCSSLLDWVNDVLGDRRVVVKDIREDFYDGQVLADLADELTGGGHHNMPSVIALSEKSQLDRLAHVLKILNDIMRVSEDESPWSVLGIHQRDMVATLRLLVAMVHHFSPDVKLPPGVVLEVMEIDRTSHGMQAKTRKEQITTGISHRSSGNNHHDGYQPDDDVFDKLFNEAPEKVDAVKTVLTKFANNHLSKVSVLITEPGREMRTGVVMLMLLQLVGKYFIPLQDYSINPTIKDEYLHNNGLVIRVMQQQNIISATCPVTPDDLVNGDLKTIFRLLYALFRKSKHMSSQS
eukprot:scpid61742/ scgid7367/ Gamma-parvin